MRFGSFSEMFSHGYTMGYNPFTAMRLFQMCRKTENQNHSSIDLLPAKVFGYLKEGSLEK